MRALRWLFVLLLASAASMQAAMPAMGFVAVSHDSASQTLTCHCIQPSAALLCALSIVPWYAAIQHDLQSVVLMVQSSRDRLDAHPWSHSASSASLTPASAAWCMATPAASKTSSPDHAGQVPGLMQCWSGSQQWAGMQCTFTPAEHQHDTASQPLMQASSPALAASKLPAPQQSSPWHRLAAWWPAVVLLVLLLVSCLVFATVRLRHSPSSTQHHHSLQQSESAGLLEAVGQLADDDVGAAFQEILSQSGLCEPPSGQPPPTSNQPQSTSNSLEAAVAAAKLYRRISDPSPVRPPKSALMPLTTSKTLGPGQLLAMDGFPQLPQGWFGDTATAPIDPSQAQAAAAAAASVRNESLFYMPRFRLSFDTRGMAYGLQQSQCLLFLDSAHSAPGQLAGPITGDPGSALHSAPHSRGALQRSSRSSPLEALPPVLDNSQPPSADVSSPTAVNGRTAVAQENLHSGPGPATASGHRGITSSVAMDSVPSRTVPNTSSMARSAVHTGPDDMQRVQGTSAPVEAVQMAGHASDGAMASKVGTSSGLWAVDNSGLPAAASRQRGPVGGPVSCHMNAVDEGSGGRGAGIAQADFSMQEVGMSQAQLTSTLHDGLDASSPTSMEVSQGTQQGLRSTAMSVTGTGAAPTSTQGGPQPHSGGAGGRSPGSARSGSEGLAGVSAGAGSPSRLLARATVVPAESAGSLSPGVAAALAMPAVAGAAASSAAAAAAAAGPYQSPAAQLVGQPPPAATTAPAALPVGTLLPMAPLPQGVPAPLPTVPVMLSAGGSQVHVTLGTTQHLMQLLMSKRRSMMMHVAAVVQQFDIYQQTAEHPSWLPPALAAPQPPAAAAGQPQAQPAAAGDPMEGMQGPGVAGTGSPQPTPGVSRPSPSVSSVTLMELIGKGASGQVYRGQWQGLEVAVKTVVFREELPGAPPSHTHSPHHRAITEAAMCRAMVHPRIVYTYAYDMTPVVSHALMAPRPGVGPVMHPSPDWRLYLVQELCQATLRAALVECVLHDKETGVPYVDTILPLLIDIASGMEYIHSKGVVHGDLKPENILLKAETGTPIGMVAKITDFGLCAVLPPGASHLDNHFNGTPFYVAPEVVQHGQLSKASDVFSFGVLMWVMWRCLPPWVPKDGGYVRNKQLGRYIVGTPLPYVLLSVRCMGRHPQQRPTFAEVRSALIHMLQCYEAGLDDLQPPASGSGAASSSSTAAVTATAAAMQAVPVAGPADSQQTSDTAIHYGRDTEDTAMSDAVF